MGLSWILGFVGVLERGCPGCGRAPDKSGGSRGDDAPVPVVFLCAPQCRSIIIRMDVDGEKYLAVIAIWQ